MDGFKRLQLVDECHLIEHRLRRYADAPPPDAVQCVIVALIDLTHVVVQLTNAMARHRHEEK